MRTRAAVRLFLGGAAASGAVLLASNALAEEPRKATEPWIFNEPAQIVDVADAFDEHDSFDLYIRVMYEQTWRRANIRRETHNSQPSFTSGGYTSSDLNIGQYEQTLNRLNLELDIGIFHDIALVFRLPIILANNQQINAVDGSGQMQGTINQDAVGAQVFGLPFKSPTRSGIEYFAAGIDVGVFNQMRDPSKPTWIIGIEGRFSISEPMHPCNASETGTAGLNQPGPQVECAYVSDINRNGVSDRNDPKYIVPVKNGAVTTDVFLEGDFPSGGQSPGISRGTTAVEFHTYLSKRIKYIEPYMGLEAFFEFANTDSEFQNSSLEGTLVNQPPMRGTFLAGASIVPWEVRDQAQRIDLDFQFSGTYVSQGRDYTELFDAIGSSDAPTLRYPSFAGYHPDPNSNTDPPGSVVNPATNTVYTTGLMDVQAHGEYRVATQFGWQAAKFVRFNLGGALNIVQNHLITFDQPCNPNFTNSLGEAGQCTTSGGNVATGIPNPMYRPSINAPGRRYKVNGSHWFDVWAGLNVMF